MVDLAYVLTTVAFFGLLLLYIKGCEGLARAAAGRGEARSQ